MKKFLPGLHHMKWLALLALIAVIGATGVHLVGAKVATHNVSVVDAEARIVQAVAPAPASSAPADDDSPAKRAESEKKIVDIFAVRTWEPPQPVVDIKPAPPPPPQAPPLPFKFLGKIADPDKGTLYLLTRRDELLSVGVGDTIDGIYRIDKYDAGQLYFLYQPLNIRQSLAVGSDS